MCCYCVCQIANIAERKAYMWVNFLLLTPNYLWLRAKIDEQYSSGNEKDYCIVLVILCSTGSIPLIAAAMEYIDRDVKSIAITTWL